MAEEGIITMFNRLGPCLNPATPAHQILEYMTLSILNKWHSLASNGSKSGWIVHGIIDEKTSQRMDELTCGTNHIRPYGTGKFKNNFGTQPLGNRPVSEKRPGWRYPSAKTSRSLKVY